MTEKRLNKQKDLDINSRVILESMPIGILLFDAEGVITYSNENFRIFVSEHLGADFDTKSNLFSSGIIDSLGCKHEIKNIIEGEPFEKLVKDFKALDDSIIKIYLKGSPVFDDEIPKGGILIVEDIKPGDENITSGKPDSRFIECITDFYFVIDKAGEILQRSSGDKNIFLKKYFSKKNKNFLEYFSGETKKLITSLITSSEEINENKTKPVQLDKKDSKSVYEFSAVPLTGSSDLLVLIRDASEPMHLLKDYENELSELRQYFDITSAILDAVINMDMHGNITFWNDSSARLFGYSRSEIFGKFIGKIISAIDKNYFKILLDELKENNSWKGEFWIETASGGQELLSTRMAISGGDEKFIVILCSSITERAKIEKELRESEERFRNIVTNTREFICTFNLEGKLLYVNPFFVSQFGYSQEELLSMNLNQLLSPEENEDFNFEGILKKPSAFLELSLRKKDGSKVYALANFTSVDNSVNTPGYYAAVFTDITEKREVEKDILMIRTVFEASQDGIAVESKRKYLLANDTFARMFGYDSAEEVVGMDPLDFVHIDYYRIVADQIKAIEQDQTKSARYDFVGIRKDGSLFDVEKSISSYKTKDGLFIVSTFRDVTKEKKTLKDLEVSEERYRSVTENINDSVWSAEEINGSIKVVFFSEAIKKISGYSPQSFIDDQRLWLRIIHPDDVNNAVKKLRGIYKDPARSSDEIEYRIINSIGNIIWIKNKVNIIRKDDGRVKKVFGLISDITLSRKAEEDLRKSKEELQVLNETKDRFISIISHDLRTPFSSILGFTDMLLSDRNMPEDRQVQYMSFIQESAKNMLSLVNSLLDWTRLQTGKINFAPQRINARYVVTRAVQMLSGVAIQKNLNLVSDLSGDVYIHADENLLLQILNNLISNAVKFTKPGGSIIISAEPLLRKRQMQFTVKDSGVGISEEDIPKLFKVDTKFTTTGTSGEKGSGIGLSLCYDIVKKHGGDIGVSSKLGVGTEFKFTIPISSTNILLVDDSKTDRLLYSKLIKNFIPEYSVMEATNGKQAFEIIKETTPALVITDHLMPVMSGYALVQQLNLSDLKFKPPVIILSSDLNDSIINDYKILGIEFAFQKPVNLTAFKFALERSLRKAIAT